MKKPQECKTIETTLELLKTDYEKLWLALIATVGGVGGLLAKGRIDWLTFLGAFLAFGEVIAMFVVRHKIIKSTERLKECEEVEK